MFMEDLQSTEKTRLPLADAARPRFSLVAGVMLFAAAITIAYWVIWFGGGRPFLASSQASSYFVFENAFPAADAWLVVTLVCGAIGLLEH
jgi:hypothetical protein